jgi:hypothetical protein
MTMQGSKTFFALAALGLALGGCSSGTITGLDFWRSYEIDGNQTGGIIPYELARRGNGQAQADKFCGQYNRPAKITFDAVASGGTIVFICVDPKAVEAPPPEQPAPKSSAKAGPPKKR